MKPTLDAMNYFLKNDFLSVNTGKNFCKSDAASSEASIQFSQVSILYVEDNVINQTLAIKVLKNVGCKCEIAASGKEALELLAVKKYDLILMDINMPVLDGLQTTKYIRQNLQLQLPVIAVTTNVSDEEIEDCKKAGMNDHVAKPYLPHQLYAVINKWCRAENMNR